MNAKVKTMSAVKKIFENTISVISKKIYPERWKRHDELAYWTYKKKSEGVLSCEHYKYFYTSQFGLDESSYINKVILDIGCGPRGSLEWASMALRRIGLDPLADEYLRLGANLHSMEYITAHSEKIPLRSGECDVVCSFNSLDHVESIGRTIQEIKRVTRAGGYFLLLVEVNHPPTTCEPHQLTPQRIIESLKPEFSLETCQVFKPTVWGMYQSIAAGEMLPQPESTKEIGYLSARFVRAPYP